MAADGGRAHRRRGGGGSSDGRRTPGRLLRHPRCVREARHPRGSLRSGSRHLRERARSARLQSPSAEPEQLRADVSVDRLQPEPELSRSARGDDGRQQRSPRASLPDPEQRADEGGQARRLRSRGCRIGLLGDRAHGRGGSLPLRAVRGE